jgi:hypothetical protein
MSAATAPILSAPSDSTRDPQTSARRPWPRRRRWLGKVARATHLTTGCRAWLLVLAGRSDDLGKPVWGTQERMGEHMGMSARTVRRYAAEAAAAGFVKVYRSTPQRGPDGRYYRRASNVYYLVMPATPPEEATEAPRRRKKAGYCVLKPTSHLADSHGPSTAPLGQGEPATAPARLECSPETGELIPLVDPEVFSAGVAQLKLALRGKKPGGLRR